jgi:hypothetical protein
MAVTNKPWDGSPSRWPDAESYAKACLIVERRPGQTLTKEDCHLPVYEPNGDLNANAVRNALARIGQVEAPATLKAAAMRKLMALRKQAGIGQDTTSK